MIDQDPHPILSDINVRKAIAHALDYGQTIIDNVYLGQGYQIASNVLPAVEWAHDSAIQPYEYDTELRRSSCWKMPVGSIQMVTACREGWRQVGPHFRSRPMQHHPREDSGRAGARSAQQHWF
ncbi:MAG: hypothetical protein R2911_13830 [Caldilineaceae bacterium]